MSKLKRSRDSCESLASSSPPQRLKRVHANSSPIRAISSSFPATPHSYHSNRTPFSIPSDSPTNPFGLKRSLVALDLPPSTPYGKHATLRLQLVTDAGAGAAFGPRRDRNGIYRVVQIPTNYTFRHLHKLILYLFASDTPQSHGIKPSASTSRLSQFTSTRRATVLSHKAAGKAPAVPVSAHSWGHYFEVQNKIALYAESKIPGAIKSGKTCAKLSSVRERRLFSDFYDPGANAVTSLPPALEDEDLDQEDWTWEAEDDLTLAHVWPKGPSLENGIIYHHSPAVRIHITANTLPVSARKGKGNTPFVFLAQGSPGERIQISHTVPDAHGNETYSTSDRELLGPTHPLSKAFIEHWNEPDAFQKFLRREADRERALRTLPTHDFSDDDHQSSAPPMISSSDGMDSSIFSSGDEFDSDAISLYSTTSDSIIYPYALSAVTPFPANPLHRKRVDRLGRRIEKLTRSVLRDMMGSDEEDKTKNGKAKDKKKTKPSTAQVSKGRKIIAKMRGRLKKKAVPDGDSGFFSEGAVPAEGWDPFGDEEELCV